MRAGGERRERTRPEIAAELLRRRRLRPGGRREVRAARADTRGRARARVLHRLLVAREEVGRVGRGGAGGRARGGGTRRRFRAAIVLLAVRERDVPVFDHMLHNAQSTILRGDFNSDDRDTKGN